MRKGCLLPKQNPDTIIVCMPNWIGDFVMGVPILQDLKTAFPNAELTAMCRKPLGELLEKDPYIDKVFSYSKPSGFQRRQEKRSMIEKLRQGKYDVGVLLTNSFSTAWWFWQGRVKQRIGFSKDGRRFLLNKSLPFPKAKDRHLVEIYKELLIPLGIKPSGTKPRLYIDDDELAKAQKNLEKFGINQNDPLIGINPGAAYGQAKCWFPKRFQAVANDLIAEGKKIVFFGDLKSKSMIDDICKELPSSVVNLAGATSLRELMAYIKLCKLLLTNDSGPMHMASALGTDVVALFGSTNPTYTGPYGKGAVIYKKVVCSPCYKRICPIDFRCMKQIEANEVLNTIKKRL